MVENRPWLNVLTQLVLILGVIVIAFPVYLAVIASTHPSAVSDASTGAARSMPSLKAAAANRRTARRRTGPPPRIHRSPPANCGGSRPRYPAAGIRFSAYLRSRTPLPSAHDRVAKTNRLRLQLRDSGSVVVQPGG